MIKLRAESWLLPDTTLHYLNGTFIVELVNVRGWIKQGPPWMSPDDADALADSLKAAAAAARNYDETGDDDERVLD